jgi:hypothetical protein
MAKTTRQTKPLHELRQEIAHSRDRLARELGGLRYELDLPLKFRKSFQRRTGVWVTAAAVLGVLFTAVPRKKKVIIKAKTGDEQKKGILEAGFAVAALKFAATLLRPALTNYIARRVTARAATQRSSRW